MSAPTVSVVIPTVGRPSLSSAVASALGQAGHNVEAVVVFDLDSVPAETRLPEGPHTVLCTGGGKGAAEARNLGVRASSGDFVAFLDDDDEWLPGKLDLQLEAARRILDRGRVPIVGSRYLQRRPSDPAPIPTPVPAALIAAGQEPQDYLFRARKVGASRPVFPTPTILTTRALARSVPWQRSLTRHQDWQWLLDAARADGTELVQVDAPTAIVSVGSTGSISAKPDWRASLEWAMSWRDSWDSRTYVDFLSAQVLRYALQARDHAGVMATLHEIRRAAAVPSGWSLYSGLLGVVPRKLAERVALRSRCTEPRKHL